MGVLVAFLIPLPDALQFPENTTYYEPDDPDVAVAIGQNSDVWQMPTGYSTSVRFVQVSAAQLHTGIEPGALRELQRYLVPQKHRNLNPNKTEPGWQTIAIAVARARDDDTSLPPVFDRCLAWVRHMCEAWRYTTHYDVLLPEYDSLPMSIALFTHDPETGMYMPGLMYLHTNPPRTLAVPSDRDTFEDRLGLMLLAMHTKHPQAVYQDRLREARCCLYRFGQRDNSVVLASTAAEALVDNTLTAIAWDCGMSPEQAAKAYYKGQGLRQRIRIHLADLLGGDWDPKGGGPVAKWDRELARLRNKVVHEGYLPSRDEAVAALEALRAFERHVIARVAAKSADYRKAAALIVARRGLEDHGMYTPDYRRWLEQDAPDDLMEAYLSWRAELFALLE